MTKYEIEIKVVIENSASIAKNSLSEVEKQLSSLIKSNTKAQAAQIKEQRTPWKNVSKEIETQKNEIALESDHKIALFSKEIERLSQFIERHKAKISEQVGPVQPIRPGKSLTS